MSVVTGRYGAFDPQQQEYRIHTPRTPRHWYNYLWNEQYVSLFSQVGQGEALSQDLFGRRIQCLNERHLFLQDADTHALWSPAGRHSGASEYVCRHGMGYSSICLHQNGIRSEWTAFVPRRERCEIWLLRVCNDSGSTRRLRLCAVVDPGLGGSLKPQSYFTCHGEYQPQEHCAALDNPLVSGGSSKPQYNYLAMSSDVCGYDFRYQSFAGFGTLSAPDALTDPDAPGCRNSGCEMEKAVLALESILLLAPGEEKTVCLIAGNAENREEIPPLLRLLEPDAAGRELERVRREVSQRLGGTVFNTPDDRLTTLATQWLPRQISLGIRWARVRHNGYRDQLQDITAFARIHPALAREELHRVLGFQYASGFAPRTWIEGQIRDNGFSDNHVWIVPAIHALIMETGDASLLEEEVPFNDGSCANLYEHGRRALEHLWNDRGQHGLCRIHEGDWDDCLNLAGKGGEGVSVWLSQAWAHAAGLQAELETISGRQTAAAQTQQRLEQMRAAIEVAAFRSAEGYYVRAYDDKGGVIGALENRKGRMFINTQSWAVLAGLPGGRRALEATEKHLASDLGTACVLDPYTGWEDNVGFMTIKRPGAQENGGIYLHASAFKLVADCLLKNRKAVSATLTQMLPFGERTYAGECEPYVFCNCYFNMPGSYRHGTPGQSWGTGTAGWFYAALLDYVYGLRPEMAGLRLEPCLPPEWRECSVRRSFRAATYEVHYRQTGPSGVVASVTVDGESFRGTHLPHQSGGHYRVEVEIH